MQNQGADVSYLRTRRTHWDNVHREPRRTGRTYHRLLKGLYTNIVPPGSTVLEIGCGRGDLLASLQPRIGVGIDFSQVAIDAASQSHSRLSFFVSETTSFSQLVPEGIEFDFIILSDILNDVWDVHAVLIEVAKVSGARTRIVGNSYRHLWSPVLHLAQRVGLMQPMLQQNWLTPKDLRNLLQISGFEIIRLWREILLPASLPLLGNFLNRYCARIWPFSALNLAMFFTARRLISQDKIAPSVSVVVPARNEAGHIEALFERIPGFPGAREIIFVEGGSSDETYEVIEAMQRETGRSDVFLMRQSGLGKGNAVRDGFAQATGDILMILDADMTVVPEDLNRFYDALVNQRGEFINGARLVYPMEHQAMQYLNKLGNSFFSTCFTYLLGQPVRDTLCGTKVLWRVDYERIAANRKYFGTADPFGDFDLLFGAARLNLKILDLPVRYRSREYGETNIRRWRHGMALLQMSMLGLRRLKFGAVT